MHVARGGSRRENPRQGPSFARQWAANPCTPHRVRGSVAPPARGMARGRRL